MKKKGLKEPVAEPVGMRTHMLIRVAVDVKQEEWFGVKLGMPQTGRQQQEFQKQEEAERLETAGIQKEAMHHQPGAGSRRLWGICHPLQALGQLRRQRKKLQQEKEREHAREQEEKRLLAEREENLRSTEAAMRKLAAEIQDLADDMRDCRCVYEDSVRKYLVERDCNPNEDDSDIQQIMWRKYFEIEEFNGYVQRFWVEQLLPKAVWNHFVILGTAPCIFAVAEQCARKMKSLRWILSENDCSEDVLDFVENFYIEYGLAITLQPISPWTKENPAALRRLRLVCETPANILDFTGEACIGVTEVAEGSIWLDMLSVEEKQRRIMGRGRGLVYISLKEKWKQAQRSQPFIPYLLDT